MLAHRKTTHPTNECHRYAHTKVDVWPYKEGPDQERGNMRQVRGGSDRIEVHPTLTKVVWAYPTEAS
jgi:hypothetical protein